MPFISEPEETPVEAWTPDRKIVAAAIAAVAVWAAQAFAGVDVPPGIEGAVAVIVAYLMPSTASKPLDIVEHPINRDDP